MADNVLTQNEIDSLLAQAIGTGESADQERFRSIRPYDFRHPSKLSKEQLRTLQMIFEGFARQVSTTLSSVLRVQVHMALVSVQQAAFDEYWRGLPTTTLLNLATAEPLPGTFVIEYDLTTAFVMLERMLGGEGQQANLGDRQVTDIEEVLLQTISSVFLQCFSDVWAHMMPLQAKLTRLEYSPRFLQIAPMNETVILLLFDLRIPKRQTTLSLCLPYSVIEPIAQELNVQTLFTVVQHDVTAEDMAEARGRLQRVAVPVVAQLGSTILPLADVNDLRIGDVIRLDGEASDPLIVTVNKRPTFLARPGLGRQSIGVQILGVVPEEVAS